MISWTKEHFRKYQEQNPWGFLWKITLEALVVVLIFSILLSVITGEKRSDIHSIMTGSAVSILIVSGIILPVIETILLQAFPVFLARLFNAPFSIQVLTAWIPFAFLHFKAGISVGVCAGLIRGFYFGFTYTHWRQISRWKALWITSLSHLINNIVLLVFLITTGYLIRGT